LALKKRKALPRRFFWRFKTSKSKFLSWKKRFLLNYNRRKSYEEKRRLIKQKIKIIIIKGAKKKKKMLKRKAKKKLKSLKKHLMKHFQIRTEKGLKLKWVKKKIREYFFPLNKIRNQINLMTRIRLLYRKKIMLLKIKQKNTPQIPVIKISRPARYLRSGKKLYILKRKYKKFKITMKKIAVLRNYCYLDKILHLKQRIREHTNIITSFREKKIRKLLPLKPAKKTFLV
jgi:hypothetical protein